MIFPAVFLINVKKEIIVKRNKRRGLVFEFTEATYYDNNSRYICKHVCPYGWEICTRLPDPRHKIYSRFSDFCSDIDVGEGPVLIPAPGSLEKYYGRLIEKIKLKI